MTAASTATPGRTLRIAIVGTGFAGLGMAIRLLDEGHDDIVLLERGDDVGGTWRDNHYPGAACDIPSHLYSLSFEPNADWTHAYAPQPEIWRYLQDVADRHDLRRRIVFDANVEEATFDETTATWTVRASDGTVVEADVMINAVGPLKDPAYPSIPGRDTFAGPSFHSARWDHSVDLTGKRVGVVGTGASAIQFVPAIADQAEHVTVFQRTAPWVTPRHDRPYTAIERLAFRHVPGLQQANRVLQYTRKELRYFFFFGHETPLGPIYEAKIRRWIRQQIDDPALADRLTPDFRLGCKRVLLSNDWYPTLNRPDVDVPVGRITEITPTGAGLDDGTHVEFDVLIYGTGFTVTEPLGEMKVTGLGGRDLTETWGTRPTGHLGITVPGFPNSFMLLGPNTGLGHNSVVVMIEAQIRYVLQAIDHLRRNSGVRYLDVRQEAHDAFVSEVDDRHAGQVWASGCQSWYLGDDGKNFTVWPGSTVEYIRRTRRFDIAAYHRETADAGVVNTAGAVPA